MPSNGPTGKRLESWKEIAAHLNKGVRTVIRWEKTEGLPVHRHQHEKKSSVFAYPSEIDAWLKSRHPEMVGEAVAEPAWWAGHRGWVAAGSVLILVVAAVGFWRSAPARPLQLPLRAEPLTAYPNDQTAAAFSPDGSHFAFAWNGLENKNGDLYLQAIGSAKPKRLTEHPDLDFSPAWSPDGKWIAFLRRAPKMRVSLHLMSPLGGGERKLADLSIRLYMDATQIAWTPDSRQVLFPDGDPEGPGLFALSVENLQKRRITKSAMDRGDSDPAVSPDGRHLAFRCDNAGVRSEICLMTLTRSFDPASKPERLTSLGAQSTSPVWAQQGEYLVFSSNASGLGAALHRLRVFPAARRSTTPEALTEGGDHEVSLASSPKHGLVAYTRRRANVGMRVVERKAGGWGEPRALASLASTRSDETPSISPDGARIAFSSTRTGIPQIWVANWDGSQLRKLDTGPDPAMMPEWSPDGTRIAFLAEPRDSPAVGVAPVDGGPARFPAKPGWKPRWSHDGKALYFSRGEAPNFRVFKVAADGGSPTQVIGTDSWNAAESPDGQYLFYVNQQGIWRRPVSGGTADLIYGQPGADRISHVPWRDGIFVRLPQDGTDLVFFLKPADRTVEVILRGDRFSSPGLAVSPDGNTVLFSRTNHVTTNLMLLRGL